MASLLILPPKEYWIDLLKEARPEIIGGIVLAILGGIATVVWRLLNRAPAPPNQTAPPPPNPPAPAPVVIHKSRSYIPRPPLAGFVARRDETGRDIVERLKEELSPEKERLIVLWGAGGVGKTTLASETARAMRDVFDGGIVWTSADGKPDYSLSTLLDDIAAHLDRPELRQLILERKDEEVHDALLKAADTLIVLDNFETISPDQQKQCAEWLANRASCPALITSRDEVAHARPVRISAMSVSEAREFLQRLISEAHNQPAFKTLDQEEIIKAADRIPLVLQWVVKQIDSAKQPRVVLDELLHGGGEAAQRVFDRSFALPQLGNDGQATLLALSLFVPSASRVALSEVAGFGGETERLEAAVQQLAELWLIQTTEGNERLRVEGLTRELTKARLVKDVGAENYQRRFVTYFQSYTNARQNRTPQDYNQLEAEKDNLLNALQIAFDLGDWDSVYDLAYKVGFPVSGMLRMRGYWAEALKANQQALDAARRSNSQRHIANFAHNAAIMYGDLGKLEDAQLLYNESLKINREIGNETGIAYCLHELARLAQSEGEFDEAQRFYNESLQIKRKLSNLQGVANTLHQLGILAQYHKGELTEAGRLYNESLEIERELDNQQGIAISLQQLAVLSQQQGELAEARRLFNESLEIKTTLGDQNGIAYTLRGLGRLAETEGNRKEAARLYDEAFVIFDRLKSPEAQSTLRDLERARK